MQRDKTRKLKYPQELPWGTVAHPEVYSACMKAAEGASYLYQKTCWIHLADAVEMGTVSPREAYSALDLGYLPEHLKVRDSHYSHML
jgi:hypothetical protein